MTPIEPTTIEEGSRIMTFGEGQEEYQPLPVVIDPIGMVTTEWEPTQDELDRLLCGARVRLSIQTFDPLLGEKGHPLSPICLDVLDPPCVVRES